MKPKVKSVTKAELRRKIIEIEAQLAHVYHFADAELHKSQNLVGSGVLIQMHALGGQQIINPVVIRDGLSPETVAAIRKDLVRSYELATMFKPNKTRAADAQEPGQ